MNTITIGLTRASVTIVVVLGFIILTASVCVESCPGSDAELEYSSASFVGESVGDLSGHAVAVVGDVNGDGFDDVLIGAYKNGEGASGAGQTYLILGRRTGWGSGLDLSGANASFLGEGVNDFSGCSVAGAGDVNGDGYDDILIGAMWNSEGGSRAGQTYLIFGKSNGWLMDTNLSDADASFIGECAYDHSGCSVDGAGDVNGDGYDDILIGAYNNSESGGNAGQTYLIYGKKSGWETDTPLSSSDVSFLGLDALERSGRVVAGAGDVNGDGYDDVIIEAWGRLVGDCRGESFLILGKASGWSMDTILSSANASFWGEIRKPFQDKTSIASVGDVNGDGFDDVLFGNWYNNKGGKDAGQAYLVLGKASGWSMNTNLSKADASFCGAAAGDEAGWSIAGAGDVNGDGFDDILIGALGAGAGSTRLGRTYLVLGKASGWSMDTNLSSVDISFLGEGLNDESGWSVAGGGDVNGDGLDDILIGAHNNNASRGKTYLVFYDDGAPPRIETDSTPQIANTGNWFTFNTTVSDNYAINNVYIEYWFGDSGSHSNVSADRSAGNWSNGTWLLTIRIPWNSTDTLHYIIHSRDRAYYVASSRVMHVPVLDDDLPTVEADATPSNATTGDCFKFSLHASDNVHLSEIWVEYWYGDTGSRTNISMAHVSGDLWDHEITVPPDSLETLHYIFRLVDNSSNTRITSVKDVDVIDNDLPTMRADGSDDGGTTGDPFTFSMEAWDNIGVEEVRVAYRYGEGPTERVVMDPSGTNLWMTTILSKDTLDEMHYVIRVTDTSGNYNYTQERVVVILDNDMPEIDARETASNATTGDPFIFIIDARDNVGLEEVWVVYWYGDGIPSNVSLSMKDAYRWEATIVVEHTMDDIHYIIGSSDTSGNINITRERTVDVIDDDPPVAYAGVDLTVAEDTIVVLNGSGSEDNIGVVNWTWTFTVDDEKRSLFGPSHSVEFNQPGEYQVDLWVRDAEGNTAYDYLILTVTDETPPRPDAGEDLEVDQGTTVTLDGSGSKDNVVIVRWVWHFVYEGAVEQFEVKTFRWKFNVPGEYVVTLTVYDAAGHQASDEVRVIVRDIIPPVAASLLNMKVDQGTEVTMDGSGSTDNLGVVRWSWAFLYGDTKVTLDGRSTTFTFDNPGEYRVNLTVEDGAGNKDTTAFLIFVKDTVAPLIPKMRDVRVGLGEAVTMDASDVTDNVGVVRFSWTFEEGGKKVVLDGSHVEHAFEKTGKYEVTLTVWDEEDNQAVETFDVNVVSHFWKVTTILLVVAVLVTGGLLYLRRRRA